MREDIDELVKTIRAKTISEVAVALGSYMQAWKITSLSFEQIKTIIDLLSQEEK